MPVIYFKHFKTNIPDEIFKKLRSYTHVLISRHLALLTNEILK